MCEALPVAKRAAARLVRTLGRADEAQVARFDRSLKPLQESTTDREALVRAIDAIARAGETALFNALYVTLKDHGARAQRQPGSPRDRGADGRRGHGLDAERRPAARPRAPRGRRHLPDRVLTEPPVGKRRETLPTFVLTALARETGGLAYFPRSLGQLESAYDGIARELRTLYGVGYVPRTSRTDGSWHRIQVQTREPNLLLRYRAGYFSPGAPSPVVTSPAR
jgi:hypothetical protein